jgi:hypothetical protein
MTLDYNFVAKAAGVIVTVGLFSVLYKENKFYRLCEHIFLGLASGWAAVVVWIEALRPLWWDKMVGSLDEASGKATSPAQWLFAGLLPIGAMSYMVFSKKHNWLSRIPLGVVLGVWSGQQIQAYFDTFGPQVRAGMKPIIPTTFDSLIVPSNQASEIVSANVYASQAISNFFFIVTLLSVLSYFLFSFEVKNKALMRFNTMGRYLLMIGFGAIFGSTVMMRFSLVIDRMYFIFIEFFQKAVFGG